MAKPKPQKYFTYSEITALCERQIRDLLKLREQAKKQLAHRSAEYHLISANAIFTHWEKLTKDFVKEDDYLRINKLLEVR